MKGIPNPSPQKLVERNEPVVMAQNWKGRRFSSAFSFGPTATAITVDEMPKIVWSVDSLAKLLRMRLTAFSQNSGCNFQGFVYNAARLRSSDRQKKLKTVSFIAIHFSVAAGIRSACP
jgi:hypothetical protein